MRIFLFYLSYFSHFNPLFLLGKAYQKYSGKNLLNFVYSLAMNSRNNYNDGDNNKDNNNDNNSDSNISFYAKLNEKDMTKPISRYMEVFGMYRRDWVAYLSNITYKELSDLEKAIVLSNLDENEDRYFILYVHSL